MHRISLTKVEVGKEPGNKALGFFPDSNTLVVTNVDYILLRSYHESRGICFKHGELDVFKEYQASSPATLLAYSLIIHFFPLAFLLFSALHSLLRVLKLALSPLSFQKLLPTSYLISGIESQYQL